jgi:GTP-binding protein
MFIDQAKIEVRSGRGGDGMVHFHREKYVTRGGPDGGDGGHGGDVVFEVAATLNTLSSFRYKSRFHAGDGARGGPNNMTGKSSPDLVIPVPPGTLIFDDASGGLLGDLVTPGQRLVIAKGGRGGRGNQHFATSRVQVPRTAERGEPAVECILRLELKLIADLGIVGVPNAGKSSFLALVTNARPKIADYPFTTVEPNLGVAELDMDHLLILADIPGLIEGAHQGVGLGFEFLRHVQRTRVLIHLLDGLSDDPIADFSQINSELALFDANLGKKPQIVALNKIDLPDVQAKWPDIRQALKARGVKDPMTVSAVAGTNVRELLWKAQELLASLPVEEPTSDQLPVYRPAEDPRAFKIRREDDGGWRLTGSAIERAAAMTFWEHEGSLRRFQRLMGMLGVEDALRQAGIQEGDTVYVGDAELEWQD